MIWMFQQFANAWLNRHVSYPAKVIEARSDKTACGLGPEGESAVAEPFAKKAGS